MSRRDRRFAAPGRRILAGLIVSLSFVAANATVRRPDLTEPPSFVLTCFVVRVTHGRKDRILSSQLLRKQSERSNRKMRGACDAW